MHKKTNAVAASLFCCLALPALFAVATDACAQEPSADSPALYQAPTEWPGVFFQITGIQRLTPARLVVMVWIQATGTTPASGVFLGTPAEIPGGIPPSKKPPTDIDKYLAKPFTMTGATMKDELSGVVYPLLPTIQVPGVAVRPGIALGTLLPGRMQVVCMEFAVPPPPPPPVPGQKPPQQTLSFLFPQAKEAILHVPLPP